MDTKITLYDVVLWEALRDKSFLDFTAKDEDDLFTLMYVHDHRLRRQYTCSIYVSTLKNTVKNGHQPKELKTFLKILADDLTYVQQFAMNNEDDEAKTDEQKERPRLTTTINAIIFQGGLEAQWTMQQGIDILPTLSQGLLERQQKEMENQRFWSLLLVSPHIRKQDNDKLRRSLKFPWEKAREGLDKITQSDINLAHAIFGKKNKDQ